jgi:hypothetical protein
MYGELFNTKQTSRPSINNPNIYMFSGCKDTQTSADQADRQSEGAFTDAFLRALKFAEYNAPMKTVYHWVCTWLAQNGFSQKPMVSSSSSTIAWKFMTSTLPRIQTPTTVIQTRFRLF